MSRGWTVHTIFLILKMQIQCGVYFLPFILPGLRKNVLINDIHELFIAIIFDNIELLPKFSSNPIIRFNIELKPIHAMRFRFPEFNHVHEE